MWAVNIKEWLSLSPQAKYKMLNFKNVELSVFDHQVTVLMNPLPEERARIDKIVNKDFEELADTVKNERKRILSRFGVRCCQQSYRP